MKGLKNVCDGREKKQTSEGKHQVINYEQGQRSGKIHSIFQGSSGKGSVLSYHRSEQTAPLCRDRRSTLWLLLSRSRSLPFAPSYPLCVYCLTTWHQAARSPSICSHSQAEETLRDRWVDERVGKKKWEKEKYTARSAMKAADYLLSAFRLTEKPKHYAIAHVIKISNY